MSGPFSASSSYTLPSVSISKVRLFLSCVSPLALRTSFTLQRSIHLNRDDTTQRMTSAGSDNCFFLLSHEPTSAEMQSITVTPHASPYRCYYCTPRTPALLTPSLPHTSIPHPTHLYSSPPTPALLTPYIPTPHFLTPPLLAHSHPHSSLMPPLLTPHIRTHHPTHLHSLTPHPHP